MRKIQHSAKVSHGRRGSRSLVVALVSLLAVGALTSCGEKTSTLRGRMFVLPGLQGSAVWGEVWLLRNYDRVKSDLSEHERVLSLALLQHDSDFLRKELPNIIRIGEIQSQVDALRQGRIPTGTTRPRNPTITPLTPIDSLFALVKIQSRVATAAEQKTLRDRIRVLQDSATVVRGRMQPSVSELSRKYATEKAALLKDADAIASRYRVTSATVRMDGEYRFEKIRRGSYALYGRYSLLRWYVLESVNVNNVVVNKDIGRLRSAISDSRAVTALDAVISEIEAP